MKLRLVWIGKTRDAALSKSIDDFVKRTRRLVPIEIAELRDPKAGSTARQLESEEKRLLAALDSTDRVVVLDAGGRQWSSAQFAAFVGNHFRSDPRRLTFVIGGYSGLTKAVRERADQVWSLSALTFTHEIARLLVAEQIYRALCILNNHPYSK